MNTKFKLPHLKKTSFDFIFKFPVHMSVHNSPQNIHFQLQDIKKKKNKFLQPILIRVNIRCIIKFV